MSKNTVDSNCMNKNMLIVMFSTNPAKNNNNEQKRVNKNIFFLYLTEFERVTSGFYLALDPSAILAHLSIGIQFIKIGTKRNVKGDYS